LRNARNAEKASGKAWADTEDARRQIRELVETICDR
jgi:hypothetical protein